MKLIHFILIVAVSFVFAGNCFAAGDDEIIVTATRHPMHTKNYAGSVSVIDAEQLETISAVHPGEFLNAVAGVNIHRGSGQEHLTAIRSPVLTGGAGAGSFLYLEDGVPLRAAGFSNVNGLFESALELAGGAEITKGPGSVLYGSNAVHGLINILSQMPSGNNGVAVDALGSTDGFFRLKTSMDGTALSGRIQASANFAHDNGFRENSGFDQQKLQIRHDANIGTWAIKTLATFQNLNQETAGFIQGVDAYKDETLARSNPHPEAFRDGKSARMSVHLNKDVAGGAQLSLIPYVRWTDLSFRRHFVPGKALEDSGHKSIGLLATYKGRANLGGHALGYILGMDSEYTKGFLREFQPGASVFSFIQGEHFDYEVKATVLSPYAQIGLQPGPQTKITIGARADYTHYNYHNNIDSGRFGRFIRVPDRRDNFFSVAPKIGITHTLNDDVSAYARYARGARAPQVTDAYSLQLGQIVGDIKSETLDSFEAGLKGKAAQVSFELAAFAMYKDGFFFRNANGFNVVDGKTNHYGIELGFAVPLTRHLHLTGGFTLADHSYAFTDIVGSPSSSIRKGNQVDTAPNTLGFMQIMAKPSESVNLSLKWQHVGDYFTDPGNTAQYPGHNAFTIRANYNLSDGVGLYGRIDNLFDAAYADRADFAFGNHRFFPARPRTLFFGIKFKT